MSVTITMDYQLSQKDEQGYRLGKAFTKILHENSEHIVEVLFQKRGDFQGDGLEWAKDFVSSELSRIKNISVHPALLSQLTLIFAGAELVFHRDNPDDKPEFKFHTVGFRLNTLFSTFSNLLSEEVDEFKPSGPFKRNTLKGLYKKHVEDASISGMATNILIENNRSNWLIQRCEEKFGPFDASKTNEINDFLLNLMLVKGQKKRRVDNRMTGEWLVYKKQNDKVHLLTLASHQESDERILARIQGA